MGTRLKRVLIPLFAAAALAGCAGGDPTGELNAPLRSAALPDVPGCDAIGALPRGVLAARAIADVHDLYVVTDDGVALCIDSEEGIVKRFGGALFTTAATNPVPLRMERASSNPMPGNPGDPSASNPMPGTDPGSSNPMPGTDPAGSNPMPGNPGDPSMSNPMPGTGPLDSNPMPGHDPFTSVFARSSAH